MTTERKVSPNTMNHPSSGTRTWETESQNYFSGSSTCSMTVSLSECLDTGKLLSAAQRQLDSMKNLADSIITINVDSENDTLLHDALKSLKSLQFGHRCSVPKIKIYIPFDKTNLNILNVIDKHNDIDKYISVTVVMDANDDNYNTDNILNVCNDFLRDRSITHDYLATFTPSCSKESIVALQRKVLCITNSSISVYLNGTIWSLSSLFHFLSFDSNACFNFGIEAVPFSPPGAMDVIYCAIKLRNFQEASGRTLQRLAWQDIISCCYMLRSNSLSFDTELGVFKPAILTYKRFHWLARILASKPDLLSAVMPAATSLIGVKEQMSELTA